MNKRKEKISAFLDNDIHRDALMSFSLSAEKEDAVTVRRYQMIGDTLRGEMSESSFVDVSHAVRDALQAEQTYGDGTKCSQSMNSAVKSQPVHNEEANNKGFFDLAAWFKPVTGMAVAALVAVVMVVSVPEQAGTDGLVATNATTAVVAQPAVQVAIDRPAIDNKTQALSQQASRNQSLANQALSKQAQAVQLQRAGKVNQHVAPYLVNQHLEYATQDTLQGRMPFVRAVSYDVVR